jgi:putative nucleotidyltransferase with HDIG domain
MFDVCAERYIPRILDYFESLAELGREVNPSAQIAQTLASTLSVMVEEFGLHRAALLAAHDTQGRLAPVAAHGFDLGHGEPIEVPRPIQQKLLRKPHVLAWRSLPATLAARLIFPQTAKMVEKQSAVVPLVTGGELVGLFVFERASELPPLAQADSDMLNAMCQNLAVYLYNQIVLSRLTEKHRELEELCGRIKEIYRQAVMAFLTAIDIKDGYTKQHSLRVAQMAAVLAHELKFDGHEVEGIYFAGLLHDIGKILVDQDILTKPGSLDLTEYAEMNAHTRLGAEILAPIQFPWENLVYTIQHHHDRPAYDEFAPPRRRRIVDLATRIISLVDAFDAMTSDRPYRRALTLDECFAEMTKGLNSQFDPETTRAFLRILARDLDRPPHQRRILTDRLFRGDTQAVRQSVTGTLLEVEQFMGIITTY